MEEGISIIYANRNRDLQRIKTSLDSLQRQSIIDFEVVFVDYGSNAPLVEAYRDLLSTYSFSNFLPLDVSHLLWNKSKALNYGIKKVKFSSIFIADVDLIFHPEALSLLKGLADSEKFFLFTLGYLERGESEKLKKPYKFEKLNTGRTGKVNGMVLAPKEALQKVNGFDEFFHFYGSEDEDLFARLENAGYIRRMNTTPYFYHNWHKSFSGSEDKLLTGTPRVKNIMRINQRHFQQNRDRGVIKPLRQKGMGEIIKPDSSRNLDIPETILKIPNILARVEHLLREELPSYQNEIIRMEFFEDPYYASLKHQLKRLLGKQSQPYVSMKELNDMVLKEILFNYRDYYYSYKISKDLKNIVFRIQV